MKKSQFLATVLMLVLGAGAVVWMLKNTGRHAHDHHGDGGHGGQEAAEAGVVKGPHGGRLLAEGDFAAEVTIFERGVPPEFRVYVYEKGKPLDPSAVKLSIALHRFGGRVDRIGFAKRDDYLLGDAEIVEPHSFDVKVSAEFGGKACAWEYASYEGRTEMSPEAASASGVVIEKAGPAKLRNTLKVHGRIAANEEHLKHVIPRFPGVVKEVRKRLGDPVARDEVLLVVESNESLQPYEVRSSLAGTVIYKHVSTGEFVREDGALFIVADLGTVWVDLSVYRRDFPGIKVGQAVTIDGGEGTEKAEGTISYVSPFGAKDNQTMLARVVLPNPDGRWRPGLYVTGEVLLDEVTVPVAVKAGALQTFRDWEVVFRRDGRTFEIAILQLGRRDAEWVEVLSGLEAGMDYVAEQSFIIKADILKSGASHDH